MKKQLLILLILSAMVSGCAGNLYNTAAGPGDGGFSVGSGGSIAVYPPIAAAAVTAHVAESDPHTGYLKESDLETSPTDAETAKAVNSDYIYDLVNTTLPAAYEPVIAVPATYVAAAGARMDSEYAQREFTVVTDPDDIEFPAGVWVDYVEISGGADDDEIDIAETNAADGEEIHITNTDAANTYKFDDTNAYMENPNNKTVYIAPGETVVYYYSNLAWHYVSGGSYDLVVASRSFGAVLTADGTYSGNVMTFTVDSGQSNTLFGQAYHIDTDGELIEADADVATSGAAPAVCLAVEAGTGSKQCLLYGQICETAWNWTIGGKIYLGDAPATTTGLTQTAPSTSGDQVQPVGIALSADTILFSPTLDTVEVP